MMTAEEFFEQGGEYPELAIKFAEMHVKAALKAAKKKAELHIQFHDRDNTVLIDSDYSVRDQDGCWCEFTVHGKSILEAYPLTNIK